MTVPSPRTRDAGVEYSYRRPLSVREMLPAIGIGVGVGLLAFYVARIVLQRTPLRVDRGPRARARLSDVDADT